MERRRRRVQSRRLNVLQPYLRKVPNETADDEEDYIEYLRDPMYLKILADTYHTYDALRQNLNGPLGGQLRRTELDTVLAREYVKSKWESFKEKVTLVNEDLERSVFMKGHEVNSFAWLFPELADRLSRYSEEVISSDPKHLSKYGLTHGGGSNVKFVHSYLAAQVSFL